MRTPRAEGMGGRDRILQEAQNLQKLNSTQTPLFGGENPELHASDFAGITPRNTVLSTPNPFAGGATPAGVTGATPTVGSTPGRSIAGVSSTPRGSVAGTPLRTPGGGMAGGSAPTPLRDELGLNNPDAALPAENQRAERARQHAALGELRAQCVPYIPCCLPTLTFAAHLFSFVPCLLHSLDSSFTTIPRVHSLLLPVSPPLKCLHWNLLLCLTLPWRLLLKAD